MPIADILLRNPVGYNMPVLAERLNHLQPLLDLNSWRVIFDVGAMDGWEGVNLAKVFTDARVYAFEPSRPNCERCTKTYMAQPYSTRSRIALSSVALTDTTGPLRFFAVDEPRAMAAKGKVNWGMGSLLRLSNPDMWPWEHNAQMEIDTMGYRMDDWIREANSGPPDAIWMDVQGAELMVLRGAELCLPHVQAIMTEVGVKPYYEGHTLKPDIDAYLAAQGFYELSTATQAAHEYEINAIYVNSRFAPRLTNDTVDQQNTITI
jgi:FkbM family methyltransferase